MMRRCAALIVGVALVAAACNSDNTSSTTTVAAPPTIAATTTTTEDPVAVAEARAKAAQDNLTKANDALASAGKQFCVQAQTYISALDRYGKVFTDTKATVGDVKTAGAALTSPRESVSAAAGSVTTAQADVASATKELADAQAALAAAQATASSVPPSSTTPTSTTTTTLVPPATITRVKQAENDLATASAGITDVTPLAQATASYNSAALALEVAWLQLVSAAGCLSDKQQAEAVAKVGEYTTALQTQLQQVGYYQSTVDGVYGPQTVDAVKKLQTDSGLPATGYVDQSTAAALDKKLAAVSQQQAAQAMTRTASVQTVLKLAGFWPGPVDGKWTPELTAALMAFQTALGVEPTGAVDAPTIAAFQQALTTLKTPPTTATTAAPAATAPPVTTAPPAAVTTAPAGTTAAPPPSSG